MEVKFKDFGEQFKKQIVEEIDKAGSETARLILKDAKANIHKISGDLERSGLIKKFVKPDVIGWYVRFTEFYSLMVEVGTPGTLTRTGRSRKPVKAMAYLRPAYKKNKNKMKKFRRI